MSKNNLELSIYTFVLKEKNKRNTYFNLGEFYRNHFIIASDKNPHKVESKTLYKRFMKEIVEEFKDEFKLNEDGTKGFSTGTLKSYGNNNIIDGFINGGDRGRNHQIFKIKNNKTSTGALGRDDVVSLPHYFKIWTPPNSEVGVLMIQNYSNTGINKLLIDFLKDFYSKYNTTFAELRHIPEDVKSSFIKSSVVKKVVFAKNKLSPKARNAFNYAFSDETGLKIKIEISGFNNDNQIGTFMDKFSRSKKMIGIDLSDLEIDEDKDVRTTLYYENDKGKKAHAKIENKFQINPAIILPDYLNKNHKIEYDEIKEYTDGILEVVKKEIDYKTE